ncbi:iron-containing alcohol dehydrogenase [Hungatella hathewayi]|mgnify:CR=1 FL=1|uniref:iron-containing alcohol dehydrogenase n=1 Tax=Hungatella hathewayi TaxID=154046 RepID=UPI00033C18BF|nr:iron-containing alcohol dehydrogenase [Hungatella hathewayi]CCZ62359.1 alcohol dehydrogenase class IV [Hungatella hathewayi CAG:224]
MDAKKKAYQLLKEWKGDDYIVGLGVWDQLGKLVVKYGSKVLLVSMNTYLKPLTDAAMESIRSAGGTILLDQAVPGAKPNAPREDVYRLETYILHYQPDVVVALGGGSTIDACKAAIALAALGSFSGPELDSYFGTGLITKAFEESGRTPIPFVAVETSASSGAHLTKYSNITDPVAGQKLLIVDPAMIPAASLFDYETTLTMPVAVSIDGALDAIAHTFEVFCGAKPETYDLAKALAETAIELTISYARRVIEDPADKEAREALGLATDLGGYAIMIGGTSGAHLTSFSLVDLVSHGTACGIMNPYYAVFYSPAIQSQLKVVGELLANHGFIENKVEFLNGRELAIAVSEGLIAFGKSIGAPTRLSDLEGFTEEHVERILTAAKDSKLSMKLQNMPISMTADDVDLYMAPIIRAAVSGDLSGIRNK